MARSPISLTRNLTARSTLSFDTLVHSRSITETSTGMGAAENVVRLSMRLMGCVLRLLIACVKPPRRIRHSRPIPGKRRSAPHRLP